MPAWIFRRAMTGACRRFGGDLHFLQHAVYAVAQAEFFLQRFQMDVRGAEFEGVHDDLVHQPDERGVGLDFGAVVGDDFDVAQGEFLDDVFEDAGVHGFFIAAVILGQGGLDVLLGGDARFDVGVSKWCSESRVFRSEGSAMATADLAVGLGDGDDAVFAGDVARDHGDDVILDLELGEMHHFRAELRGLGLGHVTRADDLVRHQ